MLKHLFSKRFSLNVILALVVIVATVLGSYYYLKFYTRQDRIVEVPDLSGYDIVEAESILDELTLEGIVVDSLYLPEHRGGEIVDQEPLANSTVKENRKIYLTIARYSSPMVKLPNIEDQTLPLALAKLSSYGIEVGEIINRPSECTDCVLEVQIGGNTIDPGAAITKGQRIDLVVGEGETGEAVSIPMVFGLNADEARTLLNRDGLNLGATVYIDCEDQDDSTRARIYRQTPDPDPNERISMGTSIDVYLSPEQDKLPDVNLDSIKSSLK